MILYAEDDDHLRPVPWFFGIAAAGSIVAGTPFWMGLPIAGCLLFTIALKLLLRRSAPFPGPVQLRLSRAGFRQVDDLSQPSDFPGLCRRVTAVMLAAMGLLSAVIVVESSGILQRRMVLPAGFDADSVAMPAVVVGIIFACVPLIFLFRRASLDRLPPWEPWSRIDNLAIERIGPADGRVLDDGQMRRPPLTEGQRNGAIVLAVCSGVLGMAIWVGLWKLAVAWIPLSSGNTKWLDQRAEWVVVGSAIACMLLGWGLMRWLVWPSFEQLIRSLHGLLPLPVTGSPGDERFRLRLFSHDDDETYEMRVIVHCSPRAAEALQPRIEAWCGRTFPPDDDPGDGCWQQLKRFMMSVGIGD